MSEWPSRFLIARWEFRRFVKPNQLMISFVLMLIIGAVGFGVGKWANRSQAKTAQVAVVGGEVLGIGADTVGNVVLSPANEADLDSLRDAVTRQKIAGVLVVANADSSRLIVRRSPAWMGMVEAHLSSARRRLQLAQSGLDEQQLASIMAPVALSTEYASGNDGRAARLAALLSVGLVLYGLFISMAYMMVSVTAEKQLRVTEQIVSAISPQTWIDGKILGISSVAFVNVLLSVVTGAVWFIGRALATGSGFSMGGIEPTSLVIIGLFALLGFLFWLSVFGAVAATIDDPNTSTRGPLMFLPALFSIPGFLVVRVPDSTFAQVTGLLPFTSSAVMSARVATTDVPVWEIVLSALLLIAGALFARRFAGRVFAIAMLMYGKEPGWREMRRWMRES